MIMKQMLIISMLTSCVILTFGQLNTMPGTLVCDTSYNSGDCSAAIPIKALGRSSFKCAPIGHGELLEIKGKGTNSKHFIEKEHNTVWLKFNAPYTALLTFKISPFKVKYDYDFLLFRDQEEFSALLSQNRILPVRSNLSRFDPEKKSETGLWPSSKKDFVRPGPGNNFSRPLPVKKGESFYLLIDNVYGGTEGFDLIFKYFKMQKITGIVTDDETEEPIEALITWEGEGLVLENTESDPKTGKFEMTVPVDLQNKKARYILTAVAYGDDHFFSEKIMLSKEVQIPELKPINMVLPQLKKGKKISLKSINFYGDSPVPLPKSKGSLKRLKQLMAKNDGLAIQIEGHTNGCSRKANFSQRLSEQRARTVKNYLVRNGVSAERISTIGYNCSRMLYPEMATPEQEMRNRRIEVVVVAY